MSEINKEDRMELNNIYINHDVQGFRKFLFKHGATHQNLADLIPETDEVLSELLYQAKSNLPYLGQAWQAARNHIRMQKFWRSTPLVEYPAPVLIFMQKNSEGFPLCNSCKWFRDPPPEAQDPCMFIGATPGDICCKGWQPVGK